MGFPRHPWNAGQTIEWLTIMSSASELATTARLRLRFEAEADLSPTEHDAISQLLMKAFPRDAEVFRNASWYGARPDHRLWLENEVGEVISHLDFEQRLIGVGDRDILVAGVGEVATHPEYTKQGLGRKLMTELHRVLIERTPVDFGYLGCLEEVVGYYQRVGWHRIKQKVQQIDPRSGEWTISAGPTLILSAGAQLSAWPVNGMVDLRGMWW